MIKFLFALIFKLTGWKFINPIPDNLRSFVFIGAPHTSNYDFIPAMAIAFLMKRNAKFVIKKSVLFFPLNLILVPMGAIAIDREKLKTGNTNYVSRMAELFKQYPELVLMISPEATRSPNDQWKSGFYHVARDANVPIVLGYADYSKKEAGFGPVVYPTDFDKDMRTITDFYKEIKGKNPENFKLDSRFKS